MYFKSEKTVDEKKKSVDERVGKKVKAVRSACGLTQQQLIDTLEIRGGKSLVSQVEHGRRTFPANVLPIIAEQGNITVESFFRDDIAVVNSVMADLLSSLRVSEENKGNVVSYMNKSFQTACKNLGDGRMFDILWSFLHTAESTTDIMEFVAHMSDSLYQIAYFNYSDDNPSKYVRYVEFEASKKK